VGAPQDVARGRRRGPVGCTPSWGARDRALAGGLGVKPSEAGVLMHSV